METPRVFGRPFPKGVSGYPGGRIPKAARTVARACRELTPEATQRLGALMRSDDEAISLAAIKEIYMRAIGKYLEAERMAAKLNGDTLPVGVSELSDDQLTRMLKIARENLP